MPCPICKKGRYPRPHAACKRLLKCKVDVPMDAIVVTAEMVRSYQAMIADFSRPLLADVLFAAQEEGWSEADESALREWMGQEKGDG